MNNKSFCHARLTRCGLGNKLTVWAKAYVFSKINDIPLFTTGWTNTHISQILKGDRRRYRNFFDSRQLYTLCCLLKSGLLPKVLDPPVEPRRIEVPHVFQFSSMPHWADYFKDLKSHRNEIISALFQMLTSDRKREICKLRPSTICLHIRMGDFRPLSGAEDFSRVGAVRTPIDFFKQAICNIRSVTGRETQVLVVSDGKPHELSEILSLPGVTLSAKQTAIADIYQLSLSKILITSAGSTFGMWGGFIGHGALCHHPMHFHSTVRGVDDSAFEGPIDEDPEKWPILLRQAVRDLN